MALRILHKSRSTIRRSRSKKAGRAYPLRPTSESRRLPAFPDLRFFEVEAVARTRPVARRRLGGVDQCQLGFEPNAALARKCRALEEAAFRVARP